MIGHFLLTLSKEQEDRVLTTGMRPGSYHSPCLVGAALTPACADAQFNFNERQEIGFLTGWKMEWNNWRTVEQRFDDLCHRFGVANVGQLIRARILSNRARRTLQNRPVQHLESVSR